MFFFPAGNVGEASGFGHFFGPGGFFWFRFGFPCLEGIRKVQANFVWGCEGSGVSVVGV